MRGQCPKLPSAALWFGERGKSCGLWLPHQQASFGDSGVGVTAVQVRLSSLRARCCGRRNHHPVLNRCFVQGAGQVTSILKKGEPSSNLFCCPCRRAYLYARACLHRRAYAGVGVPISVLVHQLEDMQMQWCDIPVFFLSAVAVTLLPAAGATEDENEWMYKLAGQPLSLWSHHSV